MTLFNVLLFNEKQLDKPCVLQTLIPLVLIENLLCAQLGAVEEIKLVYDKISDPQRIYCFWKLIL